MEERNFYELLKEAVSARLGGEYRVTGKQVVKNNSVRLEALLIERDGTNIYPTIYVGDYYEEYLQGTELGDIAEEVIRVYEACRDVKEEEFTVSPESVRNHIYYRIVNRERNEEALREMPHLEMGDFAIIFQCMMYQDGHPVGNVRIRKEHLGLWGLTEEELFLLAAKNTRQLLPPTIEPMEQVMRRILGELERQEGEEASECSAGELRTILREGEQEKTMLPMYVLSNRYNSEGATSLLYADYLDAFREQMGQDFYILPSSVHEVILVPEEAAPEYEDMCRMVKNINETQVPEQEFLSDEVMLYSAFRRLIPGNLLTEAMCG